jgi:serine phosphatase RsbU (regulator of sigma subunit)
MHHGEVIGVIDSEHPELHFYPEEDLEILTTIASITASKLIQNRYFDELTSYKNELEKLVEQRTEKLNLTLNEVQEQRTLIEAKNKDMLDSLHYAKRIQEAVLPSKQRLQQVFTSYLLFDRPKDVVSGDFFWMSESGPFVYVAVADCTGHGVPGALLSLIGYTLLNQVIAVEPQISTAQLLNKLNTRFLAELNKELNVGINDGMDISICRWDRANGSIQYSGANHPFMLVRGSKVIEMNGDRFSIGQNVGIASIFIDRVIKVESGDQVFLFSDGFRDQFGGNQQKKYKLGPFRELIRRIALEPVEQRYLSINDEFETWRGDQEQTDDVTIFSFEII